mmetsp:Transcript_1967/g.5734  ORF Transcript_1967/g.5734 Transcript_1967/m.5734 type:complete len:452 (+) Transcript_1967:818-2173(+)
MMYCLSWGNHFFVVWSTHPSTALVTMQTMPRLCAMLITLIAVSWKCLIASRTCGKSGKGWPNQAGIWSCQSHWNPFSSENQSHWSCMWSFRSSRIQEVGQRVSSQSKKIRDLKLENAPGRGCSIPFGVCTHFPESGLQSTAGGFTLGVIWSLLRASSWLVRRQSSDISIASPRRFLNGFVLAVGTRHGCRLGSSPAPGFGVFASSSLTLGLLVSASAGGASFVSSSQFTSDSTGTAWRAWSCCSSAASCGTSGATSGTDASFASGTVWKGAAVSAAPAGGCPLAAPSTAPAGSCPLAALSTAPLPRFHGSWLPGDESLGLPGSWPPSANKWNFSFVRAREAAEKVGCPSVLPFDVSRCGCGCDRGETSPTSSASLVGLLWLGSKPLAQAVEAEEAGTVGGVKAADANASSAAAFAGLLSLGSSPAAKSFRRTIRGWRASSAAASDDDPAAL